MFVKINFLILMVICIIVSAATRNNFKLQKNRPLNPVNTPTITSYNDKNNNKRSALINRPSLITESDLLEPKIVTKKPLNVVQNGPYYINHYTIYCDQQTLLEQLKNGGNGWLNNLKKLTTESRPNLYNDDNNDEIYSGDKDIYFLPIPKIEGGGGGGGGGGGKEVATETFANADFDVNSNLQNFEISLDIKPPQLPNSLSSDFLLPFHNIENSHINYNQKHNNDLQQLVDYLNQNGDGKNEILEIPHFGKHPLEHDDAMKSSYDTVGALDSYGHLATASAPLPTSTKSNRNSNLDLRHILTTKQSKFYQLIDNDSKKLNNQYSSAELSGDHLQSRHRRGQMNKVQKSEKNDEKSDRLRYPNHRYE